MITEEAVQEAIAECQGVRNPNRDTCMMLAAYYTIQDHLYPRIPPMQSFAPPPTETRPTLEAVGEYGDSAFLQAINGKNPSEAWAVMDDLMNTLLTVNRRVYDGVMRKIERGG